MPEAIRTEALRKVYPAPSTKRKRGPIGGVARFGPLHSAPSAPPRVTAEGVIALDALDLVVQQGEFFGLLGPNGAGKTTTIGILTTRVRPTAGRAMVAGADVVTNEVAVRQRIGVVPQRPNPDRALSALENLLFHAAYFGYKMSDATRHALQLLERLGIAEKANAKVDELSARPAATPDDRARARARTRGALSG